MVVKRLLTFILQLVKLANLLQYPRIRLYDAEQLMIPLEGCAHIAHQLVNVADLKNYLWMLLVTQIRIQLVEIVQGLVEVADFLVNQA